jgi:hypothetical protein
MSFWIKRTKDNGASVFSVSFLEHLLIPLSLLSGLLIFRYIDNPAFMVSDGTLLTVAGVVLLAISLLLRTSNKRFSVGINSERSTIIRKYLSIMSRLSLTLGGAILILYAIYVR